MAPLKFPAEHGPLRITTPTEGVACVQMSDATTRNALSRNMVGALVEAFAELGRDERVRAIVLSGLPEVFSSGASREVLSEMMSGNQDAAELLLPRALLDCPLPCVAAMTGYALGGGFALGIAADIVLLARESRYSVSFLNLGFTPGMGTTHLLEHVLSGALAHELLFTGDARLGRDFEGKSGINYVLSRAEVLPRAIDLAGRIAEKPRASLTVLKRALSAPRRQAFEAARTQEMLMHAISFTQPEAARLIEDAFAGTSANSEEDKP
jgi:polyketide biosynthesis enoyl-CoA hydratase PksI